MIYQEVNFTLVIIPDNPSWSAQSDDEIQTQLARTLLSVPAGVDCGSCLTKFMILTFKVWEQFES